MQDQTTLPPSETTTTIHNALKLHSTIAKLRQEIASLKRADKRRHQREVELVRESDLQKEALRLSGIEKNRLKEQVEQQKVRLESLAMALEESRQLVISLRENVDCNYNHNLPTVPPTDPFSKTSTPPERLANVLEKMPSVRFFSRNDCDTTRTQPSKVVLTSFPTNKSLSHKEKVVDQGVVRDTESTSTTLDDSADPLNSSDSSLSSCEENQFSSSSSRGNAIAFKDAPSRSSRAHQQTRIPHQKLTFGQKISRSARMLMEDENDDGAGQCAPPPRYITGSRWPDDSTDVPNDNSRPVIPFGRNRRIQSLRPPADTTQVNLHDMAASKEGRLSQLARSQSLRLKNWW